MVIVENFLHTSDARDRHRDPKTPQTPTKLYLIRLPNRSYSTVNLKLEAEEEEEEKEGDAPRIH